MKNTLEEIVIHIECYEKKIKNTARTAHGSMAPDGDATSEGAL